MEIRLATVDDVTTIVELGIDMWKESDSYGRYPYDADKVRAMMLYCIKQEDKGIAIVAESEGKVVGGFIGLVDEHWFGTSKFACDLVLFLHPNHRGGRTAIRIMQKAFEVAKAKGAESFMLSNSTGYESERVEKLYQYMGLKRLGGVYVEYFGD